MDWPGFVKRLLLVDARISEVESAMLRRAVMEGGVNRDEIKFLVHLKHSAVTVHPSFDELIVDILRRAVLKDDTVSNSEIDYLREVLLADGHVSDVERRFVEQLKSEATNLGSKYAKLREDVMAIRENDVWG